MLVLLEAINNKCKISPFHDLALIIIIQLFFSFYRHNLLFLKSRRKYELPDEDIADISHTES